MSDNQSSSTPYERYLSQLQSGVRSTASEFARQQDQAKYWKEKNSIKYLETATSAARELRVVVAKTVECTTERDMYKVLAAQLTKDVYGLQSWITYLAAVTGEKYTPRMEDPQLDSFDTLQDGRDTAASLSASLDFLKEHIVSSRLILATNRKAMSHVETLCAALESDPHIDTTLREVTSNNYKTEVTGLMTKYVAIADSE